MPNSDDVMNKLIRQQPQQPEPVAQTTATGSADGAAGTNSAPRQTPATRMNKAIRDAFKRRKGRVG